MTSRAAVQIDGPQDPRWAAALEALASGRVIRVGDVNLALEWNGSDAPGTDAPMTAEVIAHPSWHPGMTVVAAQRCRDAVRGARGLIEQLAESDAGFATLMRGRDTEVIIVDDYGNGAVLKARTDPAGDPTWV